MVIRFLSECVAWTSQRICIEDGTATRACATRQPRFAQLSLESLEERAVPATLAWRGTISDKISVAGNWYDEGMKGTFTGTIDSASNHFLKFNNDAKANKAVKLDLDLTIAALEMKVTFEGSLTLNKDLKIKKADNVSASLGVWEGNTLTGDGKLTLDGIIDAKDAQEVSWRFDWTGGTFAGKGDFEVLARTTLGIRSTTSSATTLDTRKLLNSGTTEWTSGNFRLQGGSVIRNYQIFSANLAATVNDSSVLERSVGGSEQFENYKLAQLRANIATGKTVNFNLPVWNDPEAVIILQGGGTLALNDGGANHGQISFGDPEGYAPLSTATLRLGVAAYNKVYNSPTFAWKTGATLVTTAKSTGTLALDGDVASNKGATLQLDTALDIRAEIRLTTVWNWIDGKDLTVRAKANTINGLTWTNKLFVANGAGVNMSATGSSGNEIAGNGQLLNLGTISLGHSLLLRPNTLFENQIITEQGKTTRGKLNLNDGVRIRTSDENPVLGGMFRNNADMTVQKFAYFDFIQTHFTGTSNIEFKKAGGEWQKRLYDKNGKPTIIDHRDGGGAKTSLLFQGAFDTDTTTLAALNGSTVSGEGTITSAAFLNTGTVDPYADYNAARIDFVADYSQPAGGFLRLDLFGGYGPDTIGVVGTVSLGGSLLLTVPSEGGYFPPSITILDNDASDSIQGTFNGLTEGATVAGGGNGWYYTISYQGGTGNDIVLTRHGQGDADPPPPPPPPPSSGSTISGRLWADNDGDGIQDFGETGIAGILVALLDADGLVIATTLTAADGSYSFTGLAAGTYQLYFTRPTESGSFSPTDAGSDDALDSDIWSDGFSSPLTLGTNATLDIDAGWFGVTGGGET